MRIEEQSEAIRTFFSKHAFCTEEIVFANMLESYFLEIDPIKLYHVGLTTYGRVDCELLFIYSPKIWSRFSLDDWVSLLGGVERNWNTGWALDHGGYYDIRFLISMLRLNAFRMAQFALEPGINQLRIVEYGINNSTLILRESDDVDCDEVENDPDLFRSIFEESRAQARSAVLTANPALDINDWTVDDLDQDLQHIYQSVG